MTRFADWRVSAVPELRSILVSQKTNPPQRHFDIIANSNMAEGLKQRNLSEMRGRLYYDRIVARNIAAGEMYWVSSDMTGLALDAAGDVPGFTPSTDLPAASGFMVLEKSLPPMDTWIITPELKQVNVPLSIDALSWTVVEGRIFIESYCRSENVPQARENDDSYFEPVRFFRGDGGKFFDCDDASVDESSHRLMQFLAAASHLMANPAVADRKRLAPKTPAARKAAKKGHSTDVTVVTLHAPRHVETGERNETGRTYTHRWVVRGHWRNQAHGKNHSQRRVTWVPSYTKGPAGKPLRQTERVWAWRR
jgi:hypothetical protein